MQDWKHDINAARIWLGYKLNWINGNFSQNWICVIVREVLLFGYLSMWNVLPPVRRAVLQHRRLMLLSLSLFSLLLWPVARLERLIMVGYLSNVCVQKYSTSQCICWGICLKKKSMGVEIPAAFRVMRWVCAARASEHPAAGESDLSPWVGSLGSSCYSGRNEAKVIYVIIFYFDYYM